MDAGRSRGLPAEEMLLRTMLADERLIESVVEQLDPSWLSNSVAGQTLQDIVRLYKEKRWNGPNTLLNQPRNEETGRLVSELLLNQQSVKNPEMAAAECLATLQRHFMDQRLRDTAQAIGTARTGRGQRLPRLQHQVLDLRRKLDHIAPLSFGKK